MNAEKQELKKDVEMKVINSINKIKDKLLSVQRLSTTDTCPSEIRKAIDGIKQKMTQCKLAELHPPFLPKTVTRYRHEYFLPIKKEYHLKIGSKDVTQFKTAVSILQSFVVNFDEEMMDIYLQQIREPYIRKMFNQNYEFDKLDFKEINNQYKLRTEIQNLLNNASEWLIQIQKTQDILERIQLYFDIKTPIILEKAKKEGLQVSKNRTLSDTIYSVLRNVTSYGLRRSSKVVQSSFFTALAPAAAMLTLAIIGGSATLPWPSVINQKLLVAPVVAVTVPFLLDGLASIIQRKQFLQKLQEWAITLQKVGESISKFNEQMEQTILACCSAPEQLTYQKQILNLQKYVNTLTKNIANLNNFDEQKNQQMRDRTQAYYKKYIEIQEGEWTIVVPHEEYHQQGLLKTKH